MSTPSTHLIAISDLTFESWKFFTQHWKILFKQAAWFAMGFIVYCIAAGLTTVLGRQWILWIGALILIAASVVSWVLTARTTLRLNAPENMSSASKSLPLSALILSALAIIILVALANIAGFIVFVIPGIWLSISLYFSLMFFLEDNIRGLEALKSSYRLVKGRWWATLGRLVVPAIFYGVLFGVINFALILIPIIALVIASAAFVPFSEGASSVAIALPILIVSIIAGLIILAAYTAILMGAKVIQIIVHVKLFHSLKASRSEQSAVK